jgi:hypothetical protein
LKPKIFPSSPSHSSIGPVSKKTSREASALLSTAAAAGRGASKTRTTRASQGRNETPSRQRAASNPYRDRELSLALRSAAPSHHASPKIRGRLYKTRHHHPSSPPPPFLAQWPCLPSQAPSSPAPPPAAPLPAPRQRSQRSPGPPHLPPRPRPPARPRGRAPARRRPSHPASRAASSAATAPSPAPRRLQPPSSSAGLPQRVWFATTWAGLLVKLSLRVWVAPSDAVSVSACFVSHSAATRNSYDEILTGLAKPGGGEEFGKYYSLPALSDPRIGELIWIFFFLYMLSRPRFWRYLVD